MAIPLSTTWFVLPRRASPSVWCGSYTARLHLALPRSCTFHVPASRNIFCMKTESTPFSIFVSTMLLLFPLHSASQPTRRARASLALSAPIAFETTFFAGRRVGIVRTESRTESCQRGVEQSQQQRPQQQQQQLGPPGGREVWL